MSYYKHTPPPEHARLDIREKVSATRATLDEHVPQFFEPTYEREDFKSERPVRLFNIVLLLVTAVVAVLTITLAVVSYPDKPDEPVKIGTAYDDEGEPIGQYDDEGNVIPDPNTAPASCMVCGQGA